MKLGGAHILLGLALVVALQLFCVNDWVKSAVLATADLGAGAAGAGADSSALEDLRRRPKRFKTVAHNWVFKTLDKKGDHVVGLFATKVSTLP